MVVADSTDCGGRDPLVADVRRVSFVVPVAAVSGRCADSCFCPSDGSSNSASRLPTRSSAIVRVASPSTPDVKLVGPLQAPTCERWQCWMLNARCCCAAVRCPNQSKPRIWKGWRFFQLRSSCVTYHPREGSVSRIQNPSPYRGSDSAVRAHAELNASSSLLTRCSSVDTMGSSGSKSVAPDSVTGMDTSRRRPSSVSLDHDVCWLP